VAWPCSVFINSWTADRTIIHTIIHIGSAMPVQLAQVRL